MPYGFGLVIGGVVVAVLSGVEDGGEGLQGGVTDRRLRAGGLSTWRRDTADEVEAKVAIRLGRQSVLASADFRVLLDESVLHRRIGAPEVMAMHDLPVGGVVGGWLGLG